MKTCTHKDCGLEIFSKGYCKKHYNKAYIEKTNNLISQATNPNKIDFFKREVRKAQYTLENLTK